MTLVRYESADRVATITMDRREKHNALNGALCEELRQAWIRFRDSDDRVAVLASSEDAYFSVGADVKDFPVNMWHAVPGLGVELDKPVIAAVAGPAVAGGFELALWCDVRVMESSAYFGVYCRRWGVPLVDGGTVRLPRIVGMGRALEIILTGRKVPAEEALRIGACEHLVPDGRSRDFAEAMAHEIARFPQACVRADRRSAYMQQGLPLREAMRKEWYNGFPAFEIDGAAGAARFASGKGRHGDFRDI